MILLVRCISSVGWPFEKNHLGFFTIFDGDFAKYIQDFAEKTSFVFDAIFPQVVGGPPTPVAKNAQAFYQWALENNYPPIGFYSAYPGLSTPRHQSPASRSSQVAIGHLLIALVSHGTYSPAAWSMAA